MTLVARLKPQRPRNAQATAAGAVIFLALYVAIRAGGPWDPGQGWGLTFGGLAVALLLLEMAYAARRPAAWPFRTAQRWIQAHLYFGLLALLAVMIHADFRWPQSPIGFWLMTRPTSTSLSLAVSTSTVRS